MAAAPPTGFFAKLNLGLKKEAPSASSSKEPKRLNVLVQALTELDFNETLGARALLHPAFHDRGRGGGLGGATERREAKA